MSEFQQHQFKAIDKPLSPTQRKRISALSSRSQVSSTSATFVNHYSDFRGDKLKLMTDDFDAMLYVSNWGTMRLMFRFPLHLIDKEAILKHALDTDYAQGSIEFHIKKGVLVMDITFRDEEGGGWIDEDDYSVGDFLSLREDIINGDYSLLYIAWLQLATEAAAIMEEDEEEVDFDPPPIPANLKKKSSALNDFISNFGIDKDMVKAAAAKSRNINNSAVDYKSLLAKLPLEEKEDFLLRLLKGEVRIDLLLRKRLEQLNPTTIKLQEPSISINQLKTATEKEEKRRIKKEKRQAKAAHEKRMTQIAKEKTSHWKSVYENLDLKTGSGYKSATETLKGLSEMSFFFGKEKVFQKKLDAILAGTTSQALLRRFGEAGLVEK